MSLWQDIKNKVKDFITPNTDNLSNPLEYVSIIQDLQRFRGSAMNEGDYYDFPSNVYFKILFHFGNQSDYGVGIEDTDFTDSNTSTNWGLLGASWLSANYSDDYTSFADLENLWNDGSAWSYLILNNEKERAKNLQMFVELLSNINCNTPWYFQTISGIGEAIQRSVVNTPENFNFDTEKQEITIKCLPDAYDKRLGTLLDLYRSIIWSWETKREVLPANLRKFDMTIILFEMPIVGLNSPRDTMGFSETIMRKANKIVETNEGFAVIYNDDKLGKNTKLTSYKAFEFHNCEINYSSTGRHYDEIENSEGTPIPINIEISYDDVYEIRFNEFMGETGRFITDFMGDTTPYTLKNNQDLLKSSFSELPELTKENISQYEPVANGYIAQAVGGLMSWGKTKLSQLYLGNVNGLSIAKIRQQLSQLGNLGATIHAIKDYTSPSFNGSRTLNHENLFQNNNANKSVPKKKPKNLFV